MAEITASDILFYNGSAWVSVKTDKVMIYTGLEFRNANSPNIMHYANGNFYSVGDSATFTLSARTVILLSSSSTRTITYTANNGGYPYCYAPSHLSINIDSVNKEILISTLNFKEGRSTDVLFYCSNGAESKTILVREGFNGEILPDL